MLTLAIETSCDETSVAVLEDGRKVLSNIIASQIDLHKKFGGVVPEVASRKHIEQMDIVLQEALDEANVKFDDIDIVATTYGPGLVGALLVGLSCAKALAYSLDKPLVGVNHIEGHICANYVTNPELKPPFLCLVVSGGHSHLVHVMDYGKYELLGRTRDDAAGEAFDKVSRAMGLGYPGGPIIDKLSKEGNEEAIDFPRAYLEQGSLDFSFSGLKSAVLNYLNSNKQKNIEINKADVAASFQKAVVDVLVSKTLKAAKLRGVDTIALAGGVASNSRLRSEMEAMCKKQGYRFMCPSKILCTDNAAMIGCAGYYDYKNGKISDLKLNGTPNLKLGQ